MRRPALDLPDRRWVWLAVALFLFARIASGKLPYALSYFVVGLILADWLALRYAFRMTHAGTRLDRTRFVAGDVIPVTAQLYNEGFLPVPWVTVRDTSLAREPAAGWEASLALGPLESRRLSYTVGPLPRGRHRLGRLRLRVFDFFGLTSVEMEAGEPRAVTVYPRVPRLDRPQLEPAAAAGRARRRRWSWEDTGHLAGLRPFLPGDHPKAVHWKVSARKGEPFVRRFEATTAPGLAVVLDAAAGAHVGLGLAGSEERAVEVCAGLLRHGLARGRPTRLVACGEHRVELGPLRGLPQFGRFLDALVDLRAGGAVPLAEVFTREARRARPEATLVAVSALADPALADRLKAAAATGRSVVLVLLRAETFASPGHPNTRPESRPRTSDPQLNAFVAQLRARGVAVYLLARDDDPVAVLEGRPGRARR